MLTGEPIALEIISFGFGMRSVLLIIPNLRMEI